MEKKNNTLLLLLGIDQSNYCFSIPKHFFHVLDRACSHPSKHKRRVDITTKFNMDEGFYLM